MNDLSGLDWDNKQASLLLRSQSAVPVTRPSLQLPLSRGPTPLPTQLSGSVLPASSGPKTLPPAAQDSFASLLGSSSTKKTNSLSLQERQKQLLEEKARQTQSIPTKASNGYFGGDETFWNGLGSGRNTPAQGGYTPPVAISQVRDTREDASYISLTRSCRASERLRTMTMIFLQPLTRLRRWTRPHTFLHHQQEVVARQPRMSSRSALYRSTLHSRQE